MELRNWKSSRARLYFFYCLHLSIQHLLTKHYVSGSGQCLGDAEKQTTASCSALQTCVIQFEPHPSVQDGKARLGGRVLDERALDG